MCLPRVADKYRLKLDCGTSLYLLNSTYSKVTGSEGEWRGREQEAARPGGYCS